MSLNKKIYLVGGAVRDKLMGIPICDKDYVAVGFSEDEFSNLPKVGKDFPVYLQADGTELALARVEKKVALGYNGFTTKIKDVTLKEDLARRDLTINSIAYDESTNTYIDPYNGQQDIKNKLLKHTSKAFCEDPLRVLRLARFRAKLGSSWSIDESTKDLVVTMRSELSSLQPDRVYKEIDKASNYKEFHLLFETLAQLDVLEDIFPCVGELYKKDKKTFLIAIDLMKHFLFNSLELKLSAIYYFVYRDTINTIESITDIKLPKKTRDIYLYLPNRMLSIYPTVNLFSNLDLMTGIKRRQPFFYRSKNFKESKSFIDLGRGIKIEKATGKIIVGKQKVSINRFVKTFYDNKGKLHKQIQTINHNANLNVIFMSNYRQFLVIENSVYNSLYFQLFVLENYDKELFEPTLLTPLAKVYRLKI